MKLLLEVTEHIDVITEQNESTGNKDYYITGTFLQAEVKNRNGRIYPKQVLMNEVNRYQSLIKSKRSIGELGHPATPTLNLDRASHLITELKMEGNNVSGKAKIMDTPYGKIVKNLLDEGCQLGVSSRGLGSIKEQRGVKLVQDDFTMTTVDIVADPSAPDAFVQAIYEEKEWVLVKGVWVEKDLKEAKKSISKKYTEEKALKLFEQYISKLK